MKNKRELAMYGTLIIVVSTLTDWKFKDKIVNIVFEGLLMDTDHDKTFRNHKRRVFFSPCMTVF